MFNPKKSPGRKVTLRGIFSMLHSPVGIYAGTASYLF